MNLSEIRSAARADLSGHWAEAALFTFVYLLIACIFSGTATSASDLFYSGLGSAVSLLLLPLGWGFSMCFLRNSRKEFDSFEIGKMFDGYKDFVRIFTTLLIQNILIFLWALLLVIPGIIKALSYALTPYILLDHPEMKTTTAINFSSEMMYGYKWDLFCLLLSFLGWFILAILTCGIGFFWLAPYMEASLARFYEQVKEDYEQSHSLQ